jgi:two-component SAPR family response regulator
MDILNTIAIDDELPALQVVKTYCHGLPHINLLKTFHKPGEALRWLEQHAVDLLLIDIQMPSRNGIDLFRSVQQECMAIFTTAYSEFAVEGFQVQAVDYLLKPFSPEDSNRRQTALCIYFSCAGMHPPDWIQFISGWITTW